MGLPGFSSSSTDASTSSTGAQFVIGGGATRGLIWAAVILGVALLAFAWMRRQ